MAIAVTVNEVSAASIVAGNTIHGVNLPLDNVSELYVYYGSTRLLAVLGVDYTVSIASDFNSFDLTPLASLLTKIGVAGTGNVIYMNRQVPYTNDLVPEDAFIRQRLVDEFDRNAMRFQQIANRLRTAVDHNITVSSAAPSGGSDGDIWLKV